MKTPAQIAADKRANALLLSRPRTKPKATQQLVITPSRGNLLPHWSHFDGKKNVC